MPVRTLTDRDYAVLAAKLKVEPEALMTVAHVESQGHGFFEDGFPTILFERHKFYKHANRQKRSEWAEHFPSICNAAVTPRGQYGSMHSQRTKFSLAFQLDPDAAMMACSWGAFQELGENYDDYGFESVDDFVDKMKSGIAGHLEIFTLSIRKRGLIDELQRHDWDGFARNYNGPRYRDGDYAGQMAHAYKVYKAAGTDWGHILGQAPMPFSFTSNDIAQLTNSIGEASTVQDPAGSTSSLPNEPATFTVVEPGAEAVGQTASAIGDLPGTVKATETQATAEGTRTVEASVTTSAGDPPAAEPSHWFSIEDWKPWAGRWVGRIWKAVSGLSLPTGGGFGLKAMAAGEYWWVYAVAGVGAVLFLGFIGFLATLIVVAIWLLQNHPIPFMKAKQLEILANPDMKNVGLKYEKK